MPGKRLVASPNHQEALPQHLRQIQKPNQLKQVVTVGKASQSCFYYQPGANALIELQWRRSVQQQNFYWAFHCTFLFPVTIISRNFHSGTANSKRSRLFYFSALSTGNVFLSLQNISRCVRRVAANSKHSRRFYFFTLSTAKYFTQRPQRSSEFKTFALFRCVRREKCITFIAQSCRSYKKLIN